MRYFIFFILLSVIVNIYGVEGRTGSLIIDSLHYSNQNYEISFETYKKQYLIPYRNKMIIISKLLSIKSLKKMVKNIDIQIENSVLVSNIKTIDKNYIQNFKQEIKFIINFHINRCGQREWISSKRAEICNKLEEQLLKSKIY